MSDINKIIQNSREDKSRLASDLGINLSSAQGNVNRTQTYTLHGNGNNQSSWNNSPNRYLNEGVDGLKSVNSLHSDGKDEQEMPDANFSLIYFDGIGQLGKTLIEKVSNAAGWIATHDTPQRVAERKGSK